MSTPSLGWNTSVFYYHNLYPLLSVIFNWLWCYSQWSGTFQEAFCLYDHWPSACRGVLSGTQETRIDYASHSTSHLRWPCFASFHKKFRWMKSLDWHASWSADQFPIKDEKTKLLGLITPQSFKFFSILQLEMDWLAMNPERWSEDEHFRKAKNFVKTTKVTNDVAERGVKMASDYATILTKDDHIRDMLIQGVERCRRLLPNFKKQTLNSQGCRPFIVISWR